MKNQKKIEKLEGKIRELEQERINALSKKSNGAGEVNLGKIQTRIDDLRKQIQSLK